MVRVALRAGRAAQASGVAPAAAVGAADTPIHAGARDQGAKVKIKSFAR